MAKSPLYGFKRIDKVMIPWGINVQFEVGWMPIRIGAKEMAVMEGGEKICGRTNCDVIQTSSDIDYI